MAHDLGTITPIMMVAHLQDVLLPALGYSGEDASVTDKTAQNWLHKLGYEYMGPAQAAYEDGHEQPDVKNCQKEVLDVFKALEPFMAQYEGEEMTPVPPKLLPGQKLHIIINHDESIFHVNDMKRQMWLLQGQQPLRKKGNGRSIHVSDFICKPIGRLRLVDEALTRHEAFPLDSPHCLPTTNAQKIIYPGKNHDKWWDVSQLMEQLKVAVKIFEHQFPDAIGVYCIAPPLMKLWLPMH